MNITLPDAAVQALGENAQEKVRLWAAMKGYELAELSAGAAAELAGMTKAAFMQHLQEIGALNPDISVAELDLDMETLGRSTARRG